MKEKSVDNVVEHAKHTLGLAILGRCVGAGEAKESAAGG